MPRKKFNIWLLLTVYMLLFQLLAFFLGVWIVFGALINAIRSFVVPRAHNAWLARYVFLGVNRLLQFIIKQQEKRAAAADAYLTRDRILSYLAPVALFTIPMVLLFMIQIGYMFMFWAVDGHDGLYHDEDWYRAFILSGSSLLTLGFVYADNLPEMLLAFSEAMIGLILIAMLIAYLPTMYSDFTRREAFVAKLEVRAGSPPSPIEFIRRSYTFMSIERLETLWVQWEDWFTELDETHTSLGPLNFFRSPTPYRHWITAAGVVLDGSALYVAAIDVQISGQAQLCIRSGYLALRDIASFFNIPYNSTPAPDDPISISREQFDQMIQHLRERGIPIKADVEQAWRDFAGWRVNYDAILIALARFFNAPPGVVWITDHDDPHTLN